MRLLATVCSFLLLSCIAQGQLVSTGLLAEYRITTGSGTTLVDSSGNGNNGTLVNSPTWISGEGLNFAASSSQYVTLPSGLAGSVKTIQIFGNFDVNYTQPCDVRPLLGNTSASATGIQLVMGDCTDTNVNGDPNGRLGVWSGLSIVDITSENVQRGRPGLVTAVLNTAADTFYFDSSPSSLYYALNGVQPTAGSSGVSQGSQFTLMGNPGSSRYAAGNVYWVALYSTALASGQVAQNYTYAAALLTSHGISLTVNNLSRLGTLVCDGDSITDSPFGATAYCQQIAVTKFLLPTVIRYGVGSQSLDQGLVGAPGKVDPMYAPLAGYNIVIVFMGTNDMNRNGTSSRSPAVVVADLQAYCTARIALGWKCIPVTMLSRTGNGYMSETMETLKNAYNALIKGSPQFYTAIVDLTGDSVLGCDGCSTNTMWFQDGIHPTSLGFTRIAAAISTTLNALITSSSQSLGQTVSAGQTN